MFMHTWGFRFLDIINYLGPGTSYEKWVKAYECNAVKSWFPYWQKTYAYRQTTRPTILKTDHTQSHYSLTRRAQLVCDTPNSLRDENKYLERVFQKNNYNADFIKRNIYRPSEADETNKTLHLLLQWLYLTLRAPLKPSHRSYSPTTSV